MDVRVALLALVVAAALTPARAQERALSDIAAATRETAAAPECTCRANGRNYALGARICLRTPEGPRLFSCGMELNNTSWQRERDACPES